MIRVIMENGEEIDNISWIDFSANFVFAKLHRKEQVNKDVVMMQIKRIEEE